MNQAAPRAGIALCAIGALLPGLVLGACGGGDGEEPIAVTAEDELEIVRRDDRIAPLLGGCGVTSIYDLPTANMLPRMIHKLEAGHLDPLKRAKEELGQMGADAIPDLQRFVERHYAKAFSAAYVENALDAIALNDAEEAHPIILHCLDHPQESVRLRAARALLAGHARPGDFDDLVARLGGGETEMVKASLLMALHVADPARAEALYLSWIRDGEWTGHLPKFASRLSPSRDPATAALCAELFGNVEEPWRASVAAPAARVGDEAALAYLVGLKDVPYQNVRLAAAEAMVQAGIVDVLADWVVADPDEFVRAKAAEGLSLLDELRPLHHSALTAALDDASPQVSAYALKVLCEHGDAGAIDRALNYLGEKEAVQLQAALQALREPMRTDAALVDRAWKRIHERAVGDEHMPIGMRTGVLKAIGTIPRAEAAAYLHRLGVEYTDETVEGLPAHRWLMIYAGNTGEVGRRHLTELLDEEDDPVRRLDIIGAVGSTRREATRLDLQRICEEQARTPYEVLYAASLLAKVGPAERVADRLKRVYFRLEAGEVYTAMECLLWEWF